MRLNDFSNLRSARDLQTFAAVFRRRLLLASVACVLLPASAVMAQTAPETSEISSEAKMADNDEIVVTARRREESLLAVPVAVSALSSADIERYNSSTIGQLTESVPTVIISSIGPNGGGTLSVRGIGTSANQAGFEQAVSLAVDNVQTSSARLARLGNFDLKQAEILKGPQALYFGKNSPAGVISLTSRDPSSIFEGSARAAYEFVSDEILVEGAVSGPITPDIGVRLAVQYRDMKGWLYNDAGPISPNPFNASLPIPGASYRRAGERELLGRLTLVLTPWSNLRTTVKLSADRYRDDGAGSYSQSIGPCPTGKPQAFIANVLAQDPYGECRPDNHFTNGNGSPLVAKQVDTLRGKGVPFGATDAFTATTTSHLDLSEVDLVSTTGYVRLNQRSLFGFDQTSFTQLLVAEKDRQSYFSQELRAQTKFDGPVNFMVGGYYQSTTEHYYVNSSLNTSQDLTLPLGTRCYDPSNGSFICYRKEPQTKGQTLSAFVQATWNPVDKFEVAGGVRYTHEKKRTYQIQPYGVGSFDVSNVVFADSIDQTPGVLAGRFSDSNWSPELTLSYHPNRSSTLYVAYKTGYKSGGFALGNLLTAASTLAGNSFGPERVRGFELGSKGRLFNGALTAQLVAYNYKYSDLQVTTFIVGANRFAVQNAGAVRQRGIELQMDAQLVPGFSLHGALAYNHNRFRDFVGQCYGYRFPAGTTRSQLGGAPAGTVPTAPVGCSFPDASTLTLVQNFEGRAPARSPDWSGNAGFQFKQPIGDYQISITGDTIYSGGYFPGETMAPGSHQHSYWKFNAGLRLTAPNDIWELALVGRNLTNKYVVTFSTDRTGGQGNIMSANEQRGVVDRGRIISLQVSTRF